MKRDAGGGWGSRFLAVAWLVVLLGGTGCAHFPPWRKSQAGLPPVVPEAVASPADSAGAGRGGDEAAIPTSPVKAKESAGPVKPRPVAAPAITPPVSAPPAITPPQPSDSTGTGVTLSEDIPPAEKESIVRATQRDLQETAAMMRNLDAARLAGRGGDQFRTIQALVKASQEAGDRSEFREAASLAHKAWLLAMELSGR